MDVVIWMSEHDIIWMSIMYMEHHGAIYQYIFPIYFHQINLTPVE